MSELYSDDDLTDGISSHGYCPAEALLNRIDDPEAKRILEHSQYIRLMKLVARDADNPEDAAHFSNVVNTIRDALVSYCHPSEMTVGDAERLDDLWNHKRYPAAEIGTGRIPNMDRAMLECAISDYLEADARSRHLDSWLVELAIAVEVYAFGQTLFPYRSVTGPWWPVVWQGIKSVIVVAILAVIWAVFGMSAFLVCTVLVGIRVAMIHKAQKRPQALLEKMLGAYSAMVGSGGVSVANLRRRIDDAAYSGVVWPAALFLLLEDIEGRETKLLSW